MLLGTFKIFLWTRYLLVQRIGRYMNFGHGKNLKNVETFRKLDWTNMLAPLTNRSIDDKNLQQLGIYQSIAPLFSMWHWFGNVLGAIMWSLMESPTVECFFSLVISIETKIRCEQNQNKSLKKRKVVSNYNVCE